MHFYDFLWIFNIVISTLETYSRLSLYDSSLFFAFVFFPSAERAAVVVEVTPNYDGRLNIILVY